MTPLFEAVAAGDTPRVRALLAAGADPNEREEGDNATPLHVAAANGQLDIVRSLLDAGADVHGHGDLHDGDVIGWAAGDPANAKAALAGTAASAAPFFEDLYEPHYGGRQFSVCDPNGFELVFMSA